MAGMPLGGTTFGWPSRTSRLKRGTWRDSTRCWGRSASWTRLIVSPIGRRPPTSSIAGRGFPDLLPRAKTITFFEHGAGRAPPSVDGAHRPREVAAPPKGMIYNLIVHLDVVEDWNPPRVRTPSSGQSGIPSFVSSEEEEYPRIYNFEWTAGVLDGLRARHGPAGPAVCRPQPGAHRRDNNDDGGDNGPRPPPRGLV